MHIAHAVITVHAWKPLHYEKADSRRIFQLNFQFPIFVPRLMNFLHGITLVRPYYLDKVGELFIILLQTLDLQCKIYD